MIVSRVGGRPAACFFDGGFSPIAVDVHFEDRCVVDEAIYGGESHGLVWKNSAPFAERLIYRDQQGAALVARADQFEQQRAVGSGVVIQGPREIVRGGVRAPTSAGFQLAARKIRNELANDGNSGGSRPYSTRSYVRLERGEGALR